MLNDQIPKTIQNDMSKQTTTTNKCIKVWSETSNKWPQQNPSYTFVKFLKILKQQVSQPATKPKFTTTFDQFYKLEF